MALRVRQRTPRSSLPLRIRVRVRVGVRGRCGPHTHLVRLARVPQVLQAVAQVPIELVAGGGVARAAYAPYGGEQKQRRDGLGPRVRRVAAWVRVRVRVGVRVWV